jgi:hypothetical protein
MSPQGDTAARQERDEHVNPARKSSDVAGKCRLSKERRCSHLLRYNAAPLSEDAAHPNSLEEAIYQRLS